jgi:dynein heavy chain, axonemal
MDHGSWFDLKDTSSIQLVDMQFVAAMGPPGGGRNPVTSRFLRHFNVLAISEFDDPTLKHIFSTILEWHFTTDSFASSIIELIPQLVSAILDVYQASIANLLPTPAKSHYIFNLRDYSRVVQGLLLASPEKFNDTSKVIRLFTHEVYRVFYDRLIDDADREWLFGKIKDLVETHLNVKFDQVFEHLDFNKDGKVEDDDLRSLMFGDFLTPNAAIALYDEALNIDNASEVIKAKLDDYNQVSKAPMNLVIFRFAVEHVSRISRILKQPAGHALLVGVGGSGRQSLTKLAASMAEMILFQVEITKSYGMNDWREDLKKVLTKAGGEGKPTVFLFSDNQLKMEAFLEDMNNMLNTGEVPNIFEPDEKALVIDMVRNAMLKENPKSDANSVTLYNNFVSRCKENLHIVFCMSPIGDAFRNRLRMFPALVNCCTIDWFQVWPEDALDMVASKFLEDVELENEVRRNVIKMCKSFHVTARSLSVKYFETLRRHVIIIVTVELCDPNFILGVDPNIQAIDQLEAARSEWPQN